MIIGPRKLTKQAAFIAQLLKVDDFELEIVRTRKKDPWGKIECVDDKDFIITISKDVPKKLELEILAHEMVHLRQYITGELEDIGPTSIDGQQLYVSKWRGETHISTLDADDYYLSPWEMEARALEDWIIFRWDHRRELHGRTD